MVDALRESHRVLRGDGRLIDLRPAPVHRRVGLQRGGRFLLIGVMRERLDDDRAADRAVRAALRRGWFVKESEQRFECRRVFDRLPEFEAWLERIDSWPALLSYVKEIGKPAR